MKAAATVLLVIGLALGTIGGTMRVLTVVFGDTIVRAVQSNRGQLPGDAEQVQAGVARAADRSPGHLLAIAGDLALVLAGGAIGIVVCTSRRTGALRTVLSGLVIASGIALLLLQSWVSAGAYIIGGFLTLVMADWTEKTKGTS
jgi:hypothetical protein